MSHYIHVQLLDTTAFLGSIRLLAEPLQTVRPEEETMRTLDVIAAATLVIGGLAWVLVGLSAIYQVLAWRATQKRWVLASARY